MHLIAAVSAATQGVEDATSRIVKDSVFGALLVVAVILLVWLVRRVLAIQDLRVEDQKAMSTRLERSQEKQALLIEKMTEAFTGVKATLETLNRTQQESSRVTSDLSNNVKGLQNTVDSVIREAVRSKTSRSGGYPAVRPPESR